MLYKSNICINVTTRGKCSRKGWVKRSPGLRVCRLQQAVSPATGLRDFVSNSYESNTTSARHVIGMVLHCTHLPITISLRQIITAVYPCHTRFSLYAVMDVPSLDNPDLIPASCTIFLIAIVPRHTVGCDMFLHSHYIQTL